MSTPSRLSLAIESGTVALPEAGRIAVIAPRAGADITALPAERVHIITTMKSDFDAFAARGYDCAVAPEGRYAAALVCLPRAKRLARALIAQAAEVTDGPVIVEGDKTDGVESILKDCRKRVETGVPLSKAHGKIFTLPEEADFADWRGTESEIAGGYVTAPGVFSADGIDPGSDWLARALPEKLGAHVIDLGAGWGYLAAQVLGRDTITRLDLVEADHAALTCAQRNVLDPRAAFHWADATQWQSDSRADSVIMNPPFHTGRSADPDLGRAFIASAARALKPAGTLWLVANRHLPYEATLAQRFKHVEEVAGDTRFKILQARHPSRQTR
ncbi:ribosomal RNA large subunit methyltransferase G [Roseovarius sp. A-2]|uniref:class I SAM-dependent methyltransferase n=1 Tax=Roseovarius sp. A-2 TaxID=1570360 RepID=UPI0009B55B35|nr:class I SAM-dependent methyltransferase [Roseovarius sp. A-2]GAW37248.1 ribosomal RNA large subunit methyltransferase G [Roseovarius sp. A-2]